MKSSVRKPIAVLALFVVLTLWVIGAATIGTALTSSSQWIQLVFYIVAGIGWVMPMRPIFRWMNSAPDLQDGP
ncbi:MAG: DUF2842 domain-containing protein [Pseudomonadota bacterium]